MSEAWEQAEGQAAFQRLSRCCVSVQRLAVLGLLAPTAILLLLISGQASLVPCLRQQGALLGLILPFACAQIVNVLPAAEAQN